MGARGGIEGAATRTSTVSPPTATMRLMNTSSPKSPPRPTPFTGWKMMTSPVAGGLASTGKQARSLVSMPPEQMAAIEMPTWLLLLSFPPPLPSHPPSPPLPPPLPFLLLLLLLHSILPVLMPQLNRAIPEEPPPRPITAGAHLHGHLKKRYVTFSAMSRSPISKVGYMDREGMKRGSAMNLRGAAWHRNASSASRHLETFK